MAHKKSIRRFWRVFKNMEKLNLPIIKQPLPISKSLPMDEYLEFINFNLKYTVDKKTSKTNRRLKKMLFVNVPFSLK